MRSYRDRSLISLLYPSSNIKLNCRRNGRTFALCDSEFAVESSNNGCRRENVIGKRGDGIPHESWIIHFRCVRKQVARFISNARPRRTEKFFRTKGRR